MAVEATSSTGAAVYYQTLADDNLDPSPHSPARSPTAACFRRNHHRQLLRDRRRRQPVNHVSFTVTVLVKQVVTVCIDTTATINSGNSVTVSGIYSCTRPASLYFNSVAVTEKKNTISGSTSLIQPFSCTTSKQDWSVSLVASTGTFRTGQANVGVDAVACDDFNCVDVQPTAVVTVKSTG